jgi:hypothetical protein
MTHALDTIPRRKENGNGEYAARGAGFIFVTVLLDMLAFGITDAFRHRSKGNCREHWFAPRAGDDFWARNIFGDVYGVLRAGAIVSGRAVVSGRAYFVGGSGCCSEGNAPAGISCGTPADTRTGGDLTVGFERAAA